MRKLFYLLAVVALCIPTFAFAGMDAATQTEIMAGISSSDTIYYAIGGAILVVMAGIWGFKRVKSLLGA